MAPSNTTPRSISQEAFNELVQENIDDLGMEPSEALQDAIETLTLQGVDLSGHSLHTLHFYFSDSDSNHKRRRFNRHRDIRSGRK